MKNTIPNRKVVQAEMIADEEDSRRGPWGGTSAGAAGMEGEEHDSRRGASDTFPVDDGDPEDPFAPGWRGDGLDDDADDEDDLTDQDETERKVKAMLTEAEYDSQFVPPWSPTPSAVGHAFLTQNRDAQIDIIFPTVYAEDRTAKMKDLATAEALDTVTHHRMSEHIAKELGFENYDYDEEQAQIATEKRQNPDTGGAGIADDLASTTVGLNVGADGTMSPRSPGSVGPRKPEGPKRGEISDKSVAQWKKYQGRIYSGEADAPTVKRFVRDKRGLITRIIEEDAS